MTSRTGSRFVYRAVRPAEDGARIIRWAVLLLVLVSFPFASANGPAVIALLILAVAYNSLRYSRHLRRQAWLSSSVNELAIDHFIIIYLVTLSGGVNSPYYPLLLLLIMAMIAAYGIAGFAVGLAVQGLLLLVLASAPTAPLPGDTPTQLIIRLSYLVIFSLVAEQSIASRDEEHLLETTEARRLTRDRERLLTLVNSIADPVVAVDAKGAVTLYNGAMLAILNTNRQITGLPLDDVLPLRTESGRRLSFARLAGGDEPVVRNDLVTGNDETGQINLELTLSPVRPFGGRHRHSDGSILVLRDITRQRSLDEERDEFISVASHELRTPVAIAEANLSTVLLPGFTKLDTKARTLLGQTHDNLVFLGELVHDLTTLSHAERGTLKPEITLVDLGTMLAELWRDYRSAAEAKGLKLIFVAPDAPISAVTGEHEVREILQNFITNALKYTDRGSIKLTSERAADGKVTLAVADTGIGIGVTDKPKLFQKFYRSEDFRTRRTTGTGLGLYITRKLADRIGATIQFESVLNHGSVFSLTVPPRELASD